jgi:hypothetical protein
MVNAIAVHMNWFFGCVNREGIFPECGFVAVWGGGPVDDTMAIVGCSN